MISVSVLKKHTPSTTQDVYTGAVRSKGRSEATSSVCDSRACNPRACGSCEDDGVWFGPTNSGESEYGWESYSFTSWAEAARSLRSRGAISDSLYRQMVSW